MSYSGRKSSAALRLVFFMVVLFGPGEPSRADDPTRDLTPWGIVRAIRKLLASGAAVPNQFIVLNQWR